VDQLGAVGRATGRKGHDGDAQLRAIVARPLGR
jgi:hypothetical protein